QQDLGGGDPEGEHGGQAAVRRDQQVTIAIQGEGAAGADGLVALAGEVDALAPLAVEDELPLVEQAGQEHAAVESAQLGRRRRWQWSRRWGARPPGSSGSGWGPGRPGCCSPGWATCPSCSWPSSRSAPGWWRWCRRRWSARSWPTACWCWGWRSWWAGCATGRSASRRNRRA